MRSRAVVIALSVFILASSAVAAPKSRRSPKPSQPPSSVVREPRAPSDRVQQILTRLAQKFTLVRFGDGMQPPIP